MERKRFERKGWLLSSGFFPSGCMSWVVVGKVKYLDECWIPLMGLAAEFWFQYWVEYSHASSAA